MRVTFFYFFNSMQNFKFNNRSINVFIDLLFFLFCPLNKGHLVANPVTVSGESKVVYVAIAIFSTISFSFFFLSSLRYQNIKFASWIEFGSQTIWSMSRSSSEDQFEIRKLLQLLVIT